MQEVKLNDLDYNVLAILLDRELSGYDVTQRLKNFRKTSHSRIYTVLAKLEALNFVTYRDVLQDGKPNKKLYKLTTEAIDALRIWVADDKTQRRPKVQDETIVSLLCLHLLDEETSLKLLEKNNKELENNGKKILEALEKRNMESPDSVKNHPSRQLAEIIKFYIDLDKHISDWIAKGIRKETKNRPSLREYIKKNL